MTEATTGLLARVHVVLFEPQDPVNIAGTVRAMKNMGLARLRLVSPAAYDPERIEGVAHDTREIVAGIEHFDTLEEAIAGCVGVAGFTARRRSAKREVVDPQSAAVTMLARAHDGPVALLFGREDRGLPNDALDRAHLVVTIPTTAHASLNLAQAVLIALYELHRATPSATRTLAPPRKSAPPSTSEHYERLFADSERALAALEFFKTRHSEHVMRSLRSLAYRASPDSREITLLRAIAIEVMRTIDRLQAART